MAVLSSNAVKEFVSAPSHLGEFLLLPPTCSKHNIVASGRDILYVVRGILTRKDTYEVYVSRLSGGAGIARRGGQLRDARRANEFMVEFTVGLAVG